MKTQIEQLVTTALAQLPGIAEAGDKTALVPEIERTRDRQHGDYACNIAMRLAKPLQQKPRDIAQLIIDLLPDSGLIESTQIAGPGFINFRLSPAAFHAELVSILEQGDSYGHSNFGNGEKILVEYVSANPTGPLHVGHGRHAAYGATIANLLRATGHVVHEEYYVNDAGRQMDILTLSLWVRMLEAADIEVPFPSNGYHGQYIYDIAVDAARQFADSVSAEHLHGIDTLPQDAPNGDADIYLDAFINLARNCLGEDRFTAILNHVLDAILTDIKEDLAEFGVNPDQWFFERSLMESGAVKHALDKVTASGKTYEQDGAIWFRATDYGDEKDRVVIRDNGRSTYFASDIAYHLHKRERGFDTLLDIWGADHHGYIPRVRAGIAAMGEAADILEVELVQFVALFRGADKQKMSTRSGDFITLRELRDEVGNDAARFFYVTRSNEQHLDFDLELAKSQSNDNPVYYIQYAHARVWSVMRELDTRNLDWNQHNGQQHLHLLTADHEQALQQRLARYPEILELAARQRAPQHLVHYLRDLANELHAYYNAHRFIVDEVGLRDARLLLINAVRQIIRNGLDLVGVSAPQSM
ncbi:MAG: arginine--tRNA ligase [Gammaproteobacteria bacterium]|jgi:arginyl-tRNA synthetase|nr:arginine--tRNA ligase [Chromatiales bacterium]MCP4924361.1 arginine--tRNA ligase [Gammaproteobacteria bacterium]MDP7296410.1 arginine--tRNA ligase [Gammaproteobacteria bacterium]MDP7419753.1 arginine--tRNA ligase [Gammaproteobacteria bacterium]MDP7659685.1 arginine--tRNA ligase [Gammaproteobacteria bacterium]